MSVSTTVVSRRSLLPPSTPSFTGRRRQPVESAVEGIMLGHLLAVEIGERSQRYSTDDAFAQLAIIPVLHPHQNQCAQHLRRGEAAATVVRLFEAAHQIAPHPLDRPMLLVE